MSDKVIRKAHLNRLKDGRGQGRGKDYKPFIQANDNKVASEGWLTRTLGWNSQRIHHTLSRHEYQYLLVQEWADDVVEIREQYPLDIDLTMKIAAKLNIHHPHYKGENVVMSSDFLLDTVDHSKGIIEQSRTIKPVSKLTKRTLELFEIERRYFQEIGLSWSIVFDTGKSLSLIKNIDWLYDAKHLGTRQGIDQELVDMVEEPLSQLLFKLGMKDSLSKTCLKCDMQLGLESGSSLYIVQHMLANKRWETDMYQPIRESKPLLLTFNKSIPDKIIKYA